MSVIANSRPFTAADSLPVATCILASNLMVGDHLTQAPTPISRIVHVTGHPSGVMYIICICESDEDGEQSHAAFPLHKHVHLIARGT